MNRVACIEHRPELMDCLRKFYDASFWRQVRAQNQKAAARWSPPMLALSWLAFALSEQRTLSDRFEAVREWLVAVFSKRRRPGKSYQGFIDASRKNAANLLLPLSAKMREVASARLRLNDRQRPAFAIDGSKVRVPHTCENVAAFGRTQVKGRTESGPQLLVVAAVELESRIMWDWEVAGGKASEPGLAAQIIARLPPGALIIKDAGIVGYPWLNNVLAGGRHILMRAGGNFHLWVEQTGAVLTEGGEVWLWPDNNRAQPPLRLRLIKRVILHKKKKGRKREQFIYLLTNLSHAELSDREAGKLYYKRWAASEIGFRGFKQTLDRNALLSRTPEMALLECKFSLLGMQLLGVLQRQAGTRNGEQASLAQTWRVWRQAMVYGIAGNRLEHVLSACVLDRYRRRKPKTRRRAPQQKHDYALNPPRLRRITKAIKQRWYKSFPNQIEGLI